MRIGSVSQSPSSHLPGSGLPWWRLELRTSLVGLELLQCITAVTPAPLARARRGHKSVRLHLHDEDFRRPERSLASAKRQQFRDGCQPSGLSCSAVAGNPGPRWFQSAQVSFVLTRDIHCS